MASAAAETDELTAFDLYSRQSADEAWAVSGPLC
jgi:hypothetical protein